MIRILANDFGPHHGFTYLAWEGPEDYYMNTWEVEYGDTGHLCYRNDLKDFIVHPDTIFLGERFLDLHENRSRPKIDLLAAEYIGVAKAYCLEHKITMEWQNASQACGRTAFWGDSTIGNNKIKKLNLWQPGKTHAMDSLRHMLYYVSFELKINHFVERLR